MSHEKGRPQRSGPSPTAGETCSQSTQRTDNLTAWHQQCEWEGTHQYAEGWAAGYAAGQLAIANEVAAAVGVPAYDRVAVIRDLIKGVGRVDA